MTYRSASCSSFKNQSGKWKCNTLDIHLSYCPHVFQGYFDFFPWALSPSPSSPLCFFPPARFFPPDFSPWSWHFVCTDSHFFHSPTAVYDGYILNSFALLPSFDFESALRWSK